MPMAGGGLSATLRDLARFEELMRREGEWNGRQLILAEAAQVARRGGDREQCARAEPYMPGYSYRNMWWITHNEFDAFEGLGIHGQRLYIAPRAEMVIARFASRPVAASLPNDRFNVQQFLAVGRMLQG